MSTSPKSPARDERASSGSPAPDSAQDAGSEPGQIETDDGNASDGAPPLPDEPLPGEPPLPKEPAAGAPPLPDEPVPQQSEEDDGWDCLWDANSQAWFFTNRFTGKSQWENPRVPTAAATASSSAAPQPPAADAEKPAAGGYNPAIHGDYDPTAWYAQGTTEDAEDATAAAGLSADALTVTASFNRFTGQFQTAAEGPERHSDEAKSRRQMNAFFDVDAAANAHDGRSLRAERAGKKPSKSELKAFKEKRRARKEEKRRAWLRD